MKFKMKSISEKLVKLHTIKQFVSFNQESITFKERSLQNSVKLKALTMNKGSESKRHTEQKLHNATKQLKRLQEIMMSFQKDMNTKLKI